MVLRNIIKKNNRLSDDESMYMSPDNTSIRRGRRAAPRTGVCRPCLVWEAQLPDTKHQGVILDLNPHGMKMRMLKMLGEGTEVWIQLMRDEDFQIALSHPLHAQLVRVNSAADGFVDYGVRLIMASIKNAAGQPPGQGAISNTQANTSSRMHTRDITLEEPDVNQTGRRRG
jgi:hypothetical protein